MGIFSNGNILIYFKENIQQMGNNQAKQQQKLLTQSKAKHQQFLNCYQKCKQDPSCFGTLLNQNYVSTNIHKLIPNFMQSENTFIEMILYLTKYQPSLTALKQNNQLIANIKHSTLLDRFFMLCLDVVNFKQYTTIELNKQKITFLINQYFKLFFQEPGEQNIDKILTFMKLEGKQHINAKIFADAFREYFMHTQKYLKDYFMMKFKQCKANKFLMDNWSSKIAKSDLIVLALQNSKISNQQATMLYSSQTSGTSFHSIQRKIIGYTGPWLLLCTHQQKDQNGNNKQYTFGSFQNGPIKDVTNFQGDLTGYIFTIDPAIRYMTTDKGEGGQQYFYLNTLGQQKLKMRRGLGFGGDKFKTNFKLWIDEDIDKSKVFNGGDQTYGYGVLATYQTEFLNIKVLQIWGLGIQENLQQQAKYWQQRQLEIMKRRKVNKKDLIDGNASLVFEKTFAHREQVIGEIEKRPEKE